jgi:thioredoxin 1
MERQHTRKAARMSNLTPISKDAFENNVLQSPNPVLVDFGAPWCGPCKMLDPILDELAAEYSGQVDFFYVDVDQNPELAMQYGVMGVPTLILFQNGEAVTRQTGFRPKRLIVKTFFDRL